MIERSKGTVVVFVYCYQAQLLFSADIPYGKGKYLNQTIFLQTLPSTKRALPIDFNSQKFSFVRYIFVQIFRILWNNNNDPIMTQNDTEKSKISRILSFYAIFNNFSIDIVD